MPKQAGPPAPRIEGRQQTIGDDRAGPLVSQHVFVRIVVQQWAEEGSHVKVRVTPADIPEHMNPLELQVLVVVSGAADAAAERSLFAPAAVPGAQTDTGLLRQEQTGVSATDKSSRRANGSAFGSTS